jgi:hypothetical protein
VSGADEKSLRTMLRRMVPDFLDRITIMAGERDERQERTDRRSHPAMRIPHFEGELVTAKRRASGQHPVVD